MSHDRIEYALAEGIIDPNREAWTAYGGSDGSVMVYRPHVAKKKRGYNWQRLLQTLDFSNGYWQVSVFTGCTTRYGVRIYLQRDVQVVVLIAFSGLPDGEKTEAMHLDGRRCNNACSNLRWGTKKENRQMQEEHKSQQEIGRRQWVGTRIRLECVETFGQSLWMGRLEQEEFSEMAKAKSPDAVVRRLTMARVITAEKMKEEFRNHKCPITQANCPIGYFPDPKSGTIDASGTCLPRRFRTWGSSPPMLLKQAT